MPEGASLDAAEHLMLVTVLGRLKCASALLAQKRPASLLVLVLLVEIGETLVAFPALMLVSLIPLDSTDRHMEVVPSVLRREAPAAVVAFKGFFLHLRGAATLHASGILPRS